MDPAAVFAALDAVEAMTFAQANADGGRTLAAMVPAAQPVVDRLFAARMDYDDAADVHALVVDMADAIPLPVDQYGARDNATAFENALPDLYRRHHLGDVAAMAALRAETVDAAARPSPSRWLWATLYAHLRVAAARLAAANAAAAAACDSAGPETYFATALPDSFREENVFWCAKHAGDAFTVFAAALVALQCAAGFGTPELTDLLRYYLHVLHTRYNGVLPAW